MEVYMVYARGAARGMWRWMSLDGGMLMGLLDCENSELSAVIVLFDYAFNDEITRMDEKDSLTCECLHAGYEYVERVAC